MRVFVTGATGLVGSAVVPKLIAAGHTVIGLARSDASVAKLEKWGATAARGDVTDLEVCAEASKDVDVVIHLAFDHDMAFREGNFAGACDKDRAVIKAICDSLAATAAKSSTSPLFIGSSGTLGVKGSTEKDEAEKLAQMPRYKSTELADSYVDKGLRNITVRLAPVTFGPDQLHQFISMPIPVYKQLGSVIYPDPSAGNAWPACNVEDMGDLYVLAIESKKLPNPCVIHGLGENGVPLKDVAEVLGKKLGLPTKVAPAEDIVKTIPFIGTLMTIARPASSEWTREVLGWKPHGKGLVATLEEYNLDA